MLNYSPAEGIMISVRSLQRSEGHVSWSASLDLSMSVCPFLWN